MSFPTMFRSAKSPPTQRVTLLSTYPPRLCGLATFALALERAMVRSGSIVDVVRVADDGDDSPLSGSVIGQLDNNDPASVRAAAALLSRGDVAVIQHEYGIYGGDDGEEILDLIELLSVPAIVVLHTVPLQPTPNQRRILGRLSELAQRLVVMTNTAQSRLTQLFPVDRSKVMTIPHGASTPMLEPVTDTVLTNPTQPQLLTWGLLGPGKGIEHVIDALALLDRRDRPQYTVAGVTHPKVLAREGDRYRDALVRRAHSIGVAGEVVFDDTYRDLRQLTRFVASSSVVVLPYDSKDQVTSGVLVDAVACGRPVIATAFPHALELLVSGAGIVVPHADARALSEAIDAVTSDPSLVATMAAEAQRLAPSLSWSTVAAQYLQVADELIREARPVAM